MTTPIEVTDADFETMVLGSTLPVVVDFGAPWCPPCRVIAPMMRDLAAEYAGRIVVAKVDTDDSPQITSRLSIQSAPTVLIFLHGKEIGRIVGARRKSVYQEHVEAIVEGVGV